MNNVAQWYRCFVCIGGDGTLQEHLNLVKNLESKAIVYLALLIMIYMVQTFT